MSWLPVGQGCLLADIWRKEREKTQAREGKWAKKICPS